MTSDHLMTHCILASWEILCLSTSLCAAHDRRSEDIRSIVCKVCICFQESESAELRRQLKQASGTARCDRFHQADAKTLCQETVISLEVPGSRGAAASR